MTKVHDLVEYIVKSLADEPDAVHLSEIEGETSIMLELRVASEDMGRMIGREGRTINAMRSLARVLGAKMGKKVTLEIV
ncbi:MAG: KH domain-containing protein [Anaerolineales bacterium]